MTAPFNPYTVDPRILQALSLPGSPMAAAQGNPAAMSMPSAPAPKQPSLWERLQDNVAPRPEGISNGLLSEGDHKAARNAGLLQAGAAMLDASGPSIQKRSLGQILAGGIMAGQQGYQGAIDSTIKRAGAQQGMEAQRQGMDFNKLKMEGLKTDMAKMQQMDAARQQILQKHGPMPSDPSKRIEYLTNVMNDLIAAGDNESARTISQVLLTQGSQGTHRSTYEVDKGNVIELRDIATNKVLETIPVGPKPRDSGAGAEQRQALQFQRDFDRTNRLTDDYRSDTKEIAKAANGFRSIVALAPQARAGQPAAQIGMIFSFMHTLDPSSTVREGEYATAQNAAGVPERIRNQYNKVIDGAFLTPEQIDHFVGASRAAAAGWKRQQDNLSRIYGQRAQAARVGTDGIVIDYFDGLDLNDPAPAAGKPALPKANQLFPPRR